MSQEEPAQVAREAERLGRSPAGHATAAEPVPAPSASPQVAMGAQPVGMVKLPPSRGQLTSGVPA